MSSKPLLSEIISSHEFEEIASRTLSKKAWAFYSSAATDLITRDANKSSFDRLFFRPRLLRNVKDVNVKATILGCPSALPFFISPASFAKLVHPEGERALARGASKKGIIQCISTSASYPVEDIVSSASQGYPFFFQLYVDKDRRKSELLLSKIKALGVKAIFLTIDAPVPGKREADEKVAADESTTSPVAQTQAKNDRKGGGLARVMGGYIDSTLTWEDLVWLRSCIDLPIVLKGIQTAADAIKAMEHGVDALMLSNHGGRNLDTSPPGIFILLELQRCCPEVFDAMEIYVDGGIRRGTDILKALCLGAKAVGLGRPFLYSLNYGQEGVEHFIDLLEDELKTAMQLVGITDISQANPGLVNTLDVDHLIPTALGHPYAKWSPKPKL